jgi:hypothetical protein
VPFVGKRIPVIVFIKVDFPAPFGPIIPVMLFFGREKEILSSTILLL